MLTIILGIVVAVVFMLVAANWWTESEILAPTAATVIIVVSILLGLFAPISGYKEWQLVEETDLISLSNDVASGGTGVVYVSLSANSAYTYRYEIDSEFGTETSKSYTTKTLVGENVEEIEDINCKTPVIRVYTRKAKMSIWTFALGKDNRQTKYVFYVPEGTISKEVKLN